MSLSCFCFIVVATFVAGEGGGGGERKRERGILSTIIKRGQHPIILEYSDCYYINRF